MKRCFQITRAKQSPTYFILLLALFVGLTTGCGPETPLDADDLADPLGLDRYPLLDPITELGYIGTELDALGQTLVRKVFFRRVDDRDFHFMVFRWSPREVAEIRLRRSGVAKPPPPPVGAQASVSAYGQDWCFIRNYYDRPSFPRGARYEEWKRFDNCIIALHHDINDRENADPTLNCFIVFDFIWDPETGEWDASAEVACAPKDMF